MRCTLRIDAEDCPEEEPCFSTEFDSPLPFNIALVQIVLVKTLGQVQKEAEELGGLSTADILVLLEEAKKK